MYVACNNLFSTAEDNGPLPSLHVQCLMVECATPCPATKIGKDRYGLPSLLAVPFIHSANSLPISCMDSLCQLHTQARLDCACVRGVIAPTSKADCACVRGVFAHTSKADVLASQSSTGAKNLQWFLNRGAVHQC